ncbi:MAG: CotH kinase family protein [Clostridiaceae bacterium]|nr:CotH kinase family protein [Clostridiaceae bacterium]
MIESKRFNTILSVVMVVAVLITGILMALPSDSVLAADHSGAAAYTADLFDPDQMMTVELTVDANSWQSFLDQAAQEQYIAVDVTVNGKQYASVGIRAKGNSSLTTVADSNSDRFSFKLEFDHYIDGQTCEGLDKFVLNNMQGDATYMKEYMAYKMMADMDVPTPLFAFAEITVNGEPWGCYLAVESLEESFAERVFGSDYGQLYNVKSMDGAGELTAGSQTQSQTGVSAAAAKTGTASGGSFTGGPQMDGKSAMGGQAGGGDLVYTDDDPESYTAIFGNAAFDPSAEDYQAVIKALKNLAAGTDLEASFDVDEILRYLAVHTVVVNLDSYVSNMQQNYYVYEQDGRISILPWDYNLAFGGFQSSDASAVVNFPIDTPVSGVELSARPLIAQLLAVDAYKARYHEYLQQIVTEFFDSGKFSATIDQMDALIGNAVKNDATAFYTYDEYQAALTQFKLLGSLRAESIQGQLEGVLPSTTAGQTADSSALIDTSALNLTALGTQNGGNFGGQGGDRQDSADPQNQDGQGMTPDQSGQTGGAFGNVTLPDGVDMRTVMEILSASENGTLSDEQKEQLKDLGLDEDAITQLAEMAAGMSGLGKGAGRQDGQAAAPGGFPGGGYGYGQMEPGQAVAPGQAVSGQAVPGQAGAADAGSGWLQNTYANTALEWIVLGTAVLFLAAGIIFAARLRRRKSYR